ncbi:MAG: hypothetical protein OHK0023_17540 [Anaerolineae bacterium]
MDNLFVGKRVRLRERRYQKATAEVYSFNRASIALRRMVYTNGNSMMDCCLVCCERNSRPT